MVTQVNKDLHGAVLGERRFLDERREPEEEGRAPECRHRTLQWPNHNRSRRYMRRLEPSVARLPVGCVLNRVASRHEGRGGRRRNVDEGIARALQRGWRVRLGEGRGRRAPHDIPYRVDVYNGATDANGVTLRRNEAENRFIRRKVDGKVFKPNVLLHGRRCISTSVVLKLQHPHGQQCRNLHRELRGLSDDLQHLRQLAQNVGLAGEGPFTDFIPSHLVKHNLVQ